MALQSVQKLFFPRLQRHLYRAQSDHEMESKSSTPELKDSIPWVLNPRPISTALGGLRRPGMCLPVSFLLPNLKCPENRPTLNPPQGGKPLIPASQP